MEETIIIPAILGLTEVVKRVGLPAKYAILVSLALGIAAGLLNNPTIEGGVNGLILGLSASGLWSGGKAILNK